MRIHHLDKRSAAYREFSGQIGSLGSQACASLNGNDMLKNRIDGFLKGLQLQCNTLGGIIRDIRAEGLDSIANEADRLRVEIAGAVEAEIRKFKSGQAIGHETAKPAIPPDLKPHIPGNGISGELSEMKRTGKFNAERIWEILEAEIGIIALTQCFNILGILGIETVGGKIIGKAIDKAVNMAHILDSQAVANILNALPKLGERSCPAELINRLLDETILNELCFEPEYYEQFILDLQKFDNLDEIKSTLLKSHNQTTLLLHQRLCESAKTGREPTPIQTQPSQVKPYPASQAEDNSMSSPLTNDQIAWMRRQQLVHLLQNCAQNGVTNAGDIRRAIEAGKQKVPSSIPKLAKIIAANSNEDLSRNTELHQYLIEQGY